MKSLITIILIGLITGCSSKSWREASRESINMAPLASKLKEDIVLIYHARAFSWRGYFAIHPWIAWKKKNQSQYRVAQVTSWNIRRGAGRSISIDKDLPDRLWFDSYPTLLFEARGKKASSIIKQLEPLIENYQYQDVYTIYPGPNSNTFISYLIHNIDELNIPLPPTAIGKDFHNGPIYFGKSSSSTGLEFSLYGVFGLTLAASEGVELNILGLNFGVDLWPPAIKLPFIGRIGFRDF